MTINNITSNFFGRFIDWKEFELFVADLYKEDAEVLVQHNVTMIGKSSARRQIDVLVTQKTKLHTYKTVVECKYWKDKVTRQVIDVLASSVEDLNANKGVLFTTKGYEEGAIQYANFKNIDIFLIRDLQEDEWGKPGRHILMYLQTFNGVFQSLSTQNLQFLSTDGLPPINPTFNLSLGLTERKNQKFKEEHQLFSFPNLAKGKNLVEILIESRQRVLQELSKALDKKLFSPLEKEHEVFGVTTVVVDFKNSPFKYLKHENGYMTFDSITFNLLHSITQKEMKFDRANTADFVLIVENYITNQRQYVSKFQSDEKVNISEPIQQQQEEVVGNTLQNGSILKIITDYYVSFTLPPNTKVQKTNDITIHIT